MSQVQQSSTGSASEGPVLSISNVIFLLHSFCLSQAIVSDGGWLIVVSF